MIQSPSRPLLLGITFQRGPGGWQATASLAGRNDLAIGSLRVSLPGIHFELPQVSLVFDGKFLGGEIQGTVSQAGETIPFSLSFLPALPPPASRTEAWKQDLDVVLNRFLRYDRSFSAKAREEARKALLDLKSSVVRRKDPEIMVELARIIALSGNAHTRLYLLRNRTDLRRYPLRVSWFADGLYVIKATPEYADLLGSRVTRIGGREIQQARVAVAGLYAGNRPWADYMSAYTLTSPEVLFGLHLIPDMEKARFSFVRQGKEISREISPLPLRKKDQPTEAWWDLSPLRKDPEQAWVSVLDARAKDGTLPLYLRRPDEYYWFEYLEGSKSLYFQYNRAQDMPQGETFKQFGERLKRFAEEHAIERLIVDLRFNTGGNGEVASSFMKALGSSPGLNQPGKLFVIIGRATFSAGIFHAAQLKQYTRATFVGEPVGDHLDLWGEGGNLLLPNSRLTVHYANGFHSYSSVDRPEYKPYFGDLDLEGSELEPDLASLLSFRDYLSGSDPALDVVLRTLPH